LGSSPQLTLVNIPAVKDEYKDTDELGWMEQPWIKMGSSINMYRESTIGFSVLLFSIINIALFYVWASSLVSLLTRRKEFAVLLAVGWRPNQLSKLLLYESTILGTFVAVVSWLMLTYVYLMEEANIDPSRFLLTGLAGFIVYLLGAVFPSLLVR